MKKILAAVIGLALVLTLTGCEGNKSSAQSKGQKQTEQAFGQQSAAVPYPVDMLRDSTERRMLRERLLRFNKPNRLGYVYILSMTGVPIGYYTIKGKISTPDSQMTTDQLIVDACGSSCADRHVVNAPGDDGSYGPNEPGIFFFTTEGALVETDQPYLYSDQPLGTYVDVPKLNGKGTVKNVDTLR